MKIIFCASALILFIIGLGLMIFSQSQTLAALLIVLAVIAGYIGFSEDPIMR